MLNLRSIKEEAADCRAAFTGVLVGALVLHCHHQTLVEMLLELAENRIEYILRDKPETERALRLRLFRPIPPDHLSAELAKACAELAKAYAEWTKACAEWTKACAEWAKARAEWTKACAELAKACAELAKARAEWTKACAELAKACAELAKARAELAKARAEWAGSEHHTAICPDCPWDGKTIFPR